MTTIGLVANVFNEANALPGWLECHTPFFDDVRVLHTGPGGACSTDGTIEILERWRVPVEFCTIDEGFGVVRTRALRMCPCDWVVLLDADERFFPVCRDLVCEGRPTPHSEVDEILRGYDFSGGGPDWDTIGHLGADLRVSAGAPLDQGALLRTVVAGGCDAVAIVRRHWHDFSMRRPTQSWLHDPDYQLRCVRCDPAIGFDPGTRMHEHLVGAASIYRASPLVGPYFDHFHFPFKRMEPRQRAHDVRIYDAIHEGRRPPVEP